MDDLSTGASKYAEDDSDATRHSKGYRSLRSGELADAMELGEFFQALGPVLRLPMNDGKSEVAARKRSVAAKRRRTGVLACVAVALLAGAALAPALLRALQPEEPVPAGLHGLWVARAPRYAGRTFDLSDSTLRLGVRGHEASYVVVDARRRDSADATLYTIRYRDDDAMLELGVIVGPDSVVHLRNLADVAWTRAPH